MKALCKHCQLSCKKTGLIDCNKYNSKSNRPEQLKEEINKAYKESNYELAKKLSEELFRKNHG